MNLTGIWDIDTKHTRRTFHDFQIKNVNFLFCFNATLRNLSDFRAMVACGALRQSFSHF